MYLTKFVFNTDAKILWSDASDPVTRNIRREITKADLPLNIGNVGIDNVIEYVPGKIAGIDLVYYEARNNVSFPEPTGPAILVFETRCYKGKWPDKCGVCDGNHTECEYSCDKKGGKYDICGVCNGDGTSCLGCDQVAFSTARVDLCGLCGGNNACLSYCNGTFDDCLVCNGNNSCCVKYRDVPVDRIDYFLVEYTLDDMITKLEAAREFIINMDNHVLQHNLIYRKDEFYTNTYIDIPSSVPASLTNRILSMNRFCGTTDEFISQLDSFLTIYGQDIRKPWPPLKFPFSLK